MNIENKIKAAIRKNIPELKTLVTGKMPGFVYGRKIKKGTVPVFVFHEVTSGVFEEKLQYLIENQYVTIDASELLDCLNRPKEDHSKKVVLTFDDGHISLWQVAYPLLKKYNFKAVSFICPGLVPDEENTEGMSGNRILCNWNEIKAMHDSGHVDFQSHSMSHDLVFTSSRLVDFYSPFFSSSYMGKRDTPVILRDGINYSITNLWPYKTVPNEHYFGMPIYEHAPRYAAEQRYYPKHDISEYMTQFVEENGGRSFFEKGGWRKTLKGEYELLQGKKQREMVADIDYQADIARDLRKTREAIESKLSSKKVNLICYPWFIASERALITSHGSGFSLALLGVDADSKLQVKGVENSVKVVHRTPESFIFLLPGKGRKNVLQLLSKHVFTH